VAASTSLRSRGNVDVGDLVTQAFGDDNAAAMSYAKELRSVASALAKSSGRTSILVVVLMAFFLLLVSGAPGAATIAIGPVQLQNAGIVEKILPLVVAYLTYELNVLSIRRRSTEVVLEALASKYEPSLKRSDLHRLLWPPTLALDPNEDPTATSRAESIGIVAGIVMRDVVIFLPLIFEVFAYFKLFEHHGAGDVVVWVTLALTILSMTSAVAMFVTFGERTYYIDGKLLL
jgi:hypothetical protein